MPRGRLVGRCTGAWPIAGGSGDPRSRWYACGASPAPIVASAEAGREPHGPAAGAYDSLGRRVGLRVLALECMSVFRVSRSLGNSWHAANSAILTRAEQILTQAPDRFKGVEILGNDDLPVLRSCTGGAPSAWCLTKWGDRYVAVVIDVTPVRYRAGVARLPDVVPVRFMKVVKNWLVQGTRTV